MVYHIGCCFQNGPRLNNHNFGLVIPNDFIHFLFERKLKYLQLLFVVFLHILTLTLSKSELKLLVLQLPPCCYLCTLLVVRLYLLIYKYNWADFSLIGKRIQFSTTFVFYTLLISPLTHPKSCSKTSYSASSCAGKLMRRRLTAAGRQPHRHS